jgi:hypothetical protein
MDAIPLQELQMSKRVSIRIELDEETKRDFDLLLKLKNQTISENLRDSIEGQIDQHKDLLTSIRDRFDRVNEVSDDD